MKSLPLRLLGAMMLLSHHAMGEALPGPDKAIPNAVKALSVPSLAGVPESITTAVSTASESAQSHVKCGLSHLHFGWEFEACRHFAAAIREDPECMIAHWGMVMALLAPTPETFANRNAAAERMMSLIESGVGTPLERDYAYALLKHLAEGPLASADAFRKIVGHFPNDMQAGVLTALFTRSGYDIMGEPTPDQESAEKMLRDWMYKSPGNPVPLNALLVVRAEAPKLDDTLPYARALCATHPDYAPFQYLLGHYEWRCGNHEEALDAFTKAASLFEKWMQENKITFADCPEWLDAMNYRIVTLNSMGRRQEAFEEALKLSETPLPAGRPSSPGIQTFWWETKTLPARLALDSGIIPNSVPREKLLPAATVTKELMKQTLAHWWINGLRITLEAHRQIEAGEIDKARDTVNALNQHGEMMVASQKTAIESGERSEWNRAFRALELITAEARGRLAFAGPKDGRNLAYNWFNAASDRQTQTPMMKPPMVLTSMAGQLGEYFIACDQPAEAVEAFEKALAAFPNDSRLLERLRSARNKQSKPATPASDPAKQPDR